MRDPPVLIENPIQAMERDAAQDLMARFQNQFLEETTTGPKSHPRDDRPRMIQTTAAHLREELQQAKAVRGGR